MENINSARASPPLRAYQQEDLERLKSYEGHSALCVLATGLGKTREFTEFLRWEVTQNDHRCLILSHREELVYQPLTYLKDIRLKSAPTMSRSSALRCNRWWGGCINIIRVRSILLL